MAFPYVTDFVNALLNTNWHVPLPTFGVIVVAALAVAASVTRREVRRMEAHAILPASTHSNVSDLALISGLVGARVFHIVDHPASFLSDPVAMIFSRAGFSIYGGLCFGVAAGVLFLKRHAIPVIPMLDAAAPAMLLGYAIGRLGCQLAGDGDWGIPADLALKPSWLPDWLWAQTYDGNILGVAIPPPGVYPTPLYESAAVCVLFGSLLALRSGTYRQGYAFAIYLLFAGFERLLIEKLRINPEHELLGLRVTQAEAISLALVVVGLCVLIVAIRGRALWLRALLGLGIVAALTACAPL